MTHQVLHPAGWVPAKGYANGIAARGTQVFVGGQIVAEGGKDLAEELEIEGYDKYLKAVRL